MNVRGREKEKKLTLLGGGDLAQVEASWEGVVVGGSGPSDQGRNDQHGRGTHVGGLVEYQLRYQLREKYTMEAMHVVGERDGEDAGQRRGGKRQTGTRKTRG